MSELRTLPTGASISFRQAQAGLVETVEWENAGAVLAGPLAPWRTFHWRYGQRHYSGTYWSATMRDHVIYESRLELARLIYADFDSNVTSIVAQPFMIKAQIDGMLRRRIPDFLLLGSAGPVVVDVKPLARTNVAKVAHSLAWTRELIDDLGWHYEVWSEPPPVELENLRFLAGYRDARRMNPDVIEHLRNTRIEGCSIKQAIESCARWPEPLARAGVYHLLWRGLVKTELCTPLQSFSILLKGVNS